MPPLIVPAPALAPKPALQLASPEPCRPPNADTEILHAAWAYVHRRYPAQPWPDDVYLLRDRTLIAAREGETVHIVFGSHATGFVREGEVFWHADCDCCRAHVEGIRELFVVIPAPVATPTAERQG